MSDPTRPALRHPRNRQRTQPTDAPVEALLAAFQRCSTIEERARLGASLARAGVQDDRIRAAFVRMLEDDPLNASAYLTALRDRRAVQDLTAALDRLLVSPIGDCEICQAEHLAAVATAVRLLGGSLSDEQLAGVEAAMDLAADLWIPLDDHCTPSPTGLPRAAVRREDRPGRNDPCPCGSGKKYKRCHLDANPHSSGDSGRGPEDRDPVH